MTFCCLGGSRVSPAMIRLAFYASGIPNSDNSLKIPRRSRLPAHTRQPLRPGQVSSWPAKGVSLEVRVSTCAEHGAALCPPRSHCASTGLLYSLSFSSQACVLRMAHRWLCLCVPPQHRSGPGQYRLHFWECGSDTRVANFKDFSGG